MRSQIIVSTLKEKRAAAGAATTLEQLMARAKENENLTEMPILVKADVQGSAEAIVQAMEKIGNDEVRVRVLHYGVGAITDTDVGLAEASGAPVIGFNVRANASARNSANQKGVEIRYYSIIYDLWTMFVRRKWSVVCGNSRKLHRVRADQRSSKCLALAKLQVVS